MSTPEERESRIESDIIELVTELVRIPSRAATDPSAPILDHLQRWLTSRGLEAHRMVEDHKDVGLFVWLASGKPGAALCLNACLDTAPFGDEANWKYPPTAGRVENGRLFGRGAADSKMGVAIFCRLAVELQQSGLPQGDVFLVLDEDEHTGEFGGIKAFLRAAPRRPDAVLIGYPGNDVVVVGSRGFLRAEITVFGVAEHSGASREQGFNAIVKMAGLVEAIRHGKLPIETDPEFGFGPRVTVTRISGGDGFSIVPDRCSIHVDFRLTPHVDRDVASTWIRSIVEAHDRTLAPPRPTHIEWRESWPPFRVPSEHPLVAEFLKAAEESFGRSIAPRVSGPSNVGNLFASLGIPALSGFGVGYSNIHASDEGAELGDVLKVWKTYHRVIPRLLTARF